MYTLLKQIQSGEFVHVASRGELEQAVQLARELNELWPGEYAVQDSGGNEVAPRRTTYEQQPRSLLAGLWRGIAWN